MECIFHRTCFKIRSLPGFKLSFSFGPVCLLRVFFKFFGSESIGEMF